MSSLTMVPNTFPKHAHQVLAAFTSYSALFWLISPAVSQYVVGKIYTRLPSRTQILWNMRVVSTVQATFICLCAADVIMNDSSRTAIDACGRLTSYNAITGRVQAFAAGYFIWDLLISVIYFKIFGVGSLVHAMAALLVTLLGFIPFANYYGINLVLYELSTPFLNIQWFMDKLGMTGSRAQLVNGLCLVATFFACRIAWGFYQSFSLYADMWSVWSPSSKDGPVESCRVEAWLTIAFLTANTALNWLNVYWFSLMIGAVRKRFTGSKDAKQE